MTSRYKDSLFDSLGVANKEKIHTQFLCWFFNNTNIRAEIKISFLNKIISKDAKIELTNPSISAITEFNKIDLIIIIKYGDKIKHVFAFENKLKSMLHSDQLNKYNNELKDHFNKDSEIVHKFLLSLIEEPNNDGWESFPYKKLSKIFRELQPKPTGNDKVFVDEYIQTLDNLLQAKDKFFNEPDKFKDVLVVKKSDFTEYTEPDDEDIAFVAKYQLGTIFMMSFMREKFENVTSARDFVKYEYKETRGHPLLDVVLIENEKYTLQFQYQNFTTKLQLLSPPNNNHDLDANIYNNFDKKILDIIIGYTRINPAKKGRKNYISCSKKIDCKFSELSERIQEELNAIRGILDNIIKSLEG